MADNQMVGLILFTEVPKRGLVAILQRRGEYNFEDWRTESFPGGCQLTVWGGVNGNETIRSAFWREIQEELGSESFNELINGPHPHPIPTDSPIEYRGKLVETFVWARKVPKEFIANKIRLAPSSGGIMMVDEKEAEKLGNLKDYDSKQGVRDRLTIAIFPDSKTALLRAFQWAKTEPES